MGMRVLMISLEKGLTRPDHRARARIASYGSFVEQLDIILFSAESFEETIAPHVKVIATHSSSPLWYVWDALKLVWKKRRETYDVVTAQDVTETGLVGYLAARFFQVRFAAQDVGYLFHGEYYARESWLNRLRARFGHWLVRRADSVRVMSVRSEETLRKLSIPATKIVRFPFKLDAQFAAHKGSLSEEEQALLNHRPYFLIPGRFVHIKRIDLALEAFSGMIHHPDLLLVLIGQGPLEPMLRERIAHLNLRDRVIIRPWTSALAAWYRGASATIITSDREGYCMTALESLASGTPVIMTDVGSAPELIQDGVNGYIIPVGDVERLKERMEETLLHQEKLRAHTRTFTWKPPNVGMKDLFERAIHSTK